MRNYLYILLLGFMLSTNTYAKNTDQTILSLFHKYGITKCDNYILENSKLGGNWNIFITKHSGGLDASATEVSLITITGKKGDTVKNDYSYIQTKKNCFLHKRSMISFPGSCDSNVDGNSWYKSKNMPNKDYTQYSNGKGVDLYAKDISVGNFQACVMEYNWRTKGKQN